MRLNIPPHIDPDHPINTQEYAVYTPAIHDMVEQLSGWIDRQATGGYIYGPSRFGKSRAIKWYVRTALEERFRSTAPLVVWIRESDSHLSATELIIYWQLF